MKTKKLSTKKFCTSAVVFLILTINLFPVRFGNLELPALALKVARAQTSLPAFPGAQGYGAVATGGRGGQVIHVTNLNASGPGSLQAAVSAPGARIVVFDVSGVINGDVNITEPNLTIAGQTAPGAGITIAGQFTTEYDFGIDNIIVRFVRVRPGPLSGAGGDAIQFSRSRRVILDHISVAWGIDEVVDIYEAQDVTVQYSTIEESGTTGHPEGQHNYALINGPDGARVSIHHNLFAHHRKRSPALANGPSDTRNNVIYNHHIGFLHDNPATGVHNIVGNYYKAGPNRNIIEPFYMVDDNDQQGRAFWADNFIDDDSPLFSASINDPLAEQDRYPGLNGSGVRVTTPANTPPVTTQSSQAAYSEVLDRAGTFPRDVVTSRTVQETRDRNGSWGIHRPANLMQGLTPSTRPTDTDNDGMPDAWELARGLNPNNSSDRNAVLPSGYTAIEDYVNELADSLIPSANCAASIAPSNAAYSVAGGTGSVGVTIPAGCVWTVAASAGWSNIASGGSGSGTINYTVAPNNGGARSGTISVAGKTFTIEQAGNSNCQTAPPGASFTNTAFANQTGSFSIQFDATPAANNIDSGMGLSNGAQTSYTGLAAIVRFNPSGLIDARNGGAYAAASTIPYSANQAYRFRLVVNLAAKTYSAYVTPPSGSEITIGSNFAFRTEQNSVAQLNNLGVKVDASSAGGNSFCNITLGAACLFAINPASASFSSSATTGSVSVTTGASCAWTATSNASWLAITSGASSSDSGAASYSVAANTSAAARTGSVGVTSGTGCIWTATSALNWLSVTSGASGSGNGTVGYSVAGNTGAARTGAVTVGGQTVTVNQNAGAGCKTGTAGAGYVNTAFANQTGTFTAQFDAAPSNAPTDSPMGLSVGAQNSSANFAALVRFSPSGNIDARNGGAYAAASMIPYSANQTYRFRLVVNVGTKTYSAYVTPPGGTEKAVGMGYAFRAQSAQLNNWGVNVDAAASGTNKVCNFAIN